MLTDGVTTDFSGYTLVQLNQMLGQSNPASCLSAAQGWNSVGKLLHEQASSLESRLRSSDAGWSGTAAAEYKQMMADLVGGIRKVADTAFRTRDAMYYALDALNTARAEMPAPVDVPVVAPATVALAAAPVRAAAGTSPLVVAQLQQQHAIAMQAVQQQQRAVATASAARAKAVAVMQALVVSYVAAQDVILPSPGAALLAPGSLQPAATTAGPASITSSASGSLLAASQSATTQSGTAAIAGASDSQSNPVFGDMFTIGLAVAAAAAVGRFGALMPAVPGFAKGQQGGKKARGQRGRKSKAQAGGTPQLGGGIAAGGAASATVAGAVAAPPSAGPGMGGADPGSLVGLAADNAAGAAIGASGGQSAMPMMPMMPMGGMARAGLGGAGSVGRRNPPWLVETHDVWGESFPAAPGLIGD